MQNWPEKESDLGPPVITWLKDRGYTVYQEVEIETQSKRADIVGVMYDKDSATSPKNLTKSHIFVIELKKSLGLDVIAQALYWRQYANQVAVCVPTRNVKRYGRKYREKHDPARLLAGDLLEWKGIGLLEIEKQNNYEGDPIVIHESVPAPIKIISNPRLLNAIRAEQQTYAEAGNSTGKRWTKFRATCERLKAHVKANPRITLKQALTEIQHHYASAASARQNLANLIDDGVVAGLKLENGILVLRE